MAFDRPYSPTYLLNNFLSAIATAIIKSIAYLIVVIAAARIVVENLEKSPFICLTDWAPSLSSEGTEKVK